MTHMGHYENGQRGVNAPGDVALARYLNEGDLDMIVGGHSRACMYGRPERGEEKLQAR